MWRLAITVGLVGCFGQGTALGNTLPADFAEVEIGVGEARLEPGMCSDGGFGGPCDRGWNHLARIGAARGRRVASWLALIGQGSFDGVLWQDSFRLGGIFIGGGARAEALNAHLFADLIVGLDIQFGSTGSGESGLASGASLAPKLRGGARFGDWFVAVEAAAMPLNRGTLGLDVFDLSLAAGYRW